MDHSLFWSIFLEDRFVRSKKTDPDLLLGSAIKDNMLDESSAMMLECGLQTHPAIEPCRFDSFALGSLSDQPV